MLYHIPHGELLFTIINVLLTVIKLYEKKYCLQFINLVFVIKIFYSYESNFYKKSFLNLMNVHFFIPSTLKKNEILLIFIL